MVKAEHSDEFDPNADQYEELDKELEGIALSDVDEFEKHPLWRLFAISLERRYHGFRSTLDIGDIELKVKLYPENYIGYKLRTNEAIRGALSEMLLTGTYLDEIRGAITETQEELQSQKELEEEEDG